MGEPAFGTPLGTLMAYELKKYPDLQVPLIIGKSLAYLMEKGLNTEGLFRVPGSTPVVNKYKGIFDAGDGYKIDFLDEELGDEMTADNIASLLKLYLRELPEPLFTKEKDASFCELMDDTDDAARVTKYREMISQLPQVNQQVVKALLFYLMQVSANSSTNMMHADNLSIVFGEMAGVFARNGKLIVTWLINNFPTIYEEKDLREAKLPFFQRKLVGHLRSVIGVIQNGDYVWSIDGMGEIRVWQRLDMQFFKAFGTSLQFITPPVFFDDKLWCFAPGVLKTCPTSILLDPDVPEPKQRFSDVALPQNSLFVVGLPVGDQIWAAGDRVSVIGKDLAVSDLTAAHPQTIIKTIALIGKQVWAIKGKSLLVFDSEQRTLINEIAESTFGEILKICEVGDRVWLVGNAGAQGTIWVINKETFATEKVINRHKGAIYTAAQLGSLVWTVAWDCKIYTWKADTLDYVRFIPNLHRDAIREILPIAKDELNGWQVWTGSSDRSINIVFVPFIYDQFITPETPEEQEAIRKKDEEEERKKEEKRRKEAEALKKKRELKQSSMGNVFAVAGGSPSNTPPGSPDDSFKRRDSVKDKKKDKEKEKEDKKKEKEEKKKEKESKKLMKNSQLEKIKKSSSHDTVEAEKTAMRDIEALMKQTKMSHEGVDTLKERLSEKLFSLWKAYDKDNSGELDSNEQDALFSALYESIHKKEKKKDKRVELLSRWKSFFDSDGNGTLSKDEFENGILFLRFADTVEKVVIAEELRTVTAQPATALSKKADLSEREMMVLELFSSERDVVAALQIIDLVYKKTIMAEVRENKKLQKLEKEMNTLIDPVLRPLAVHQELSAALQARLDQSSDTIGDIIKEKVNKFSVYALPEMVNFHTKNLPAFLKLISDNSTLKEIFDDLENLMYGVVSRKVTYYIALTLRRAGLLQSRLAAILQHTPKEHPDHAALEEAVSELKAIAAKIQSAASASS